MGVIIISGDVNRGATSLRKGLQEVLGWGAVTAGDYFRAYAKEHGFPLEDKHLFPDDFERKVDNDMVFAAQNGHNVVLEGHYLGWLTRELPEVYRILVICSQKKAEFRAFNRDGESAERVRARQEGLRAKFAHLYGPGNYLSPDHFHQVISTNSRSIPRTVAVALEGFRAFTEYKEAGSN